MIEKYCDDSQKKKVSKICFGWFKCLYKTWSLVSNSSLSKIFALCSLESSSSEALFYPSEDHFHKSSFLVRKKLWSEIFFGGVLLVVLVPLVTLVITP